MTSDHGPGRPPPRPAEPASLDREQTRAEPGELESEVAPDGGDQDSTGASAMAFLRELPILLLVAFALAFLLRTFVVQVFFIPSGSMEPTLQVHDRIIVEKVTFRFRDPARGEIVVFEGENGFTPPEDTGVGARIARGIGQFLGVVPANARDFVKRVIGLPGDTVMIEEGTVTVNGEPISEPYVEFEDTQTQGPFEVPEGKLFFLGDNRPNSSDSRSSLGYVDMDQVVGRAVLIVWPFDHLDTLSHPDFGPIPEPTAATGAIVLLPVPAALLLRRRRRRWG